MDAIPFFFFGLLNDDALPFLTKKSFTHTCLQYLLNSLREQNLNKFKF